MNLERVAVLGVVLVAGLAARLAFLSEAPPLLMTTDSITYALPAIHLAHGEGFDLSLRRTPAYPMFLAVLWRTFGDSAQPVVYAQHLLGVITAGLSWQLGRVVFGPVAGLIAGLAVAVSGPQIVYEHYLMTESVFTLLLVLGMLALVVGLRRAGAGLYLVSGLLFGLCALARPIGQVLPLLVPIGVLASAQRPPRESDGSPSALSRAAKAGLLGLLGFAVVALPWVVRNQVVGGELTSSSALGKTLFGRITRHDDGLRFDLPAAGTAETDPVRAQARAGARQAAQEDTSRGSLVHERLMLEFGYTEAQGYNVMRDVALEVLLAQPAYYVQSSLWGAVQLLLGQEEPLRSHIERLANPRLRREWQARPELAHLLPEPVSPEARAQSLNRANRAVRVYQPSVQPLSSVIGLLFAVGTLGTLLKPAWRTALPIPLLVLTVLLISAFLDGPVPRFRYPVDPFIALTAAAGLLACVQLTKQGLRWRPRQRAAGADSASGTFAQTGPRRA